MKRLGSGQRIGNTYRRQSQTKSRGGGSLIEKKPYKLNPQRATNRPRRLLQKKEGGGKKRAGKGKKMEKNKGGKGKR